MVIRWSETGKPSDYRTTSRRNHWQAVGRSTHAGSPGRTSGRSTTPPDGIRPNSCRRRSDTAEQIETAAGYHQPDTLPESIKTDSKTGTGRADPDGRQHTPPDRSSRKSWQIIINRYAPETLAHFQTVRPLRHTTPRTHVTRKPSNIAVHAPDGCRRLNATHTAGTPTDAI